MIVTQKKSLQVSERNAKRATAEQARVLQSVCIKLCLHACLMTKKTMLLNFT